MPHDFTARSRTVIALIGAAGLIAGGLMLTPAAAQTEPAATTPTTAAPAGTPTDPAAAPPVTAKPASGKPSPGRRAPSKDPAVLAADGRNPAGVIITTSPALDGVPVTSVQYDGAAIRRDADARDLADANHRVTVGEAALARLELDRQALVGLIGRTDARRRKLERKQDVVDVSLRSIAVQRYVHGSHDDEFLDPTQTLDEQLERSHVATITATAESTVELQVRTVNAATDQATTTLDNWHRQQAANENDTAVATRDLTKARSDADIATASIAAAEEELRLARPMTVVEGSDLPLVALDAYWRATNDLAATRSGCRLRWWGLAGIGRTESNHGRSAGGQAGPDGALTVPVYGIPLDGTNGTRRVPDTDKGALDLDPDLDRAVGPMQFIPGTWKRWAEDESGDRMTDPQNIYDAALASGKLLCSTFPDLDTDAGLRKAYFAYNHSNAYVEKVLGYARGYESLPVPVQSTDATG